MAGLRGGSDAGRYSGSFTGRVTVLLRQIREGPMVRYGVRETGDVEVTAFGRSTSARHTLGCDIDGLRQCALASCCRIAKVEHGLRNRQK